jgi:hypothetical protein
MPDDGGGYDPKALGGTFGKKLEGYLNTPVPGMDAATEHGLNTLQNTVQTFQPGLNNAFNLTSDIINKGGMASGGWANVANTEDAANKFQELAYGSGFNPEMQASMAGNTDALNDYRSMADSFANPMTAPGYQTLRAKLADDVTTNNLSSFNNSGMFGSDDNRSSLAEGLGNALAGADMQQQQNAIANRFQALSGQTGAAGQGFGMGNQGIQNRMGAMQGQLGASQQAYNMRNGASDRALAASSMLPSQFAATMLPSQAMIDIGKQKEGYQNADYNRFQELLSAFTGSQDNPGMAEEAPWWQTLLGGVGSLAGAFF